AELPLGPVLQRDPGAVVELGRVAEVFPGDAAEPGGLQRPRPHPGVDERLLAEVEPHGQFFVLAGGPRAALEPGERLRHGRRRYRNGADRSLAVQTKLRWGDGPAGRAGGADHGRAPKYRGGGRPAVRRRGAAVAVLDRDGAVLTADAGMTVVSPSPVAVVLLPLVGLRHVEAVVG